jgi:hypothetical protein
MMMSSLVPMACALFFVQRTEAEALANADKFTRRHSIFRTELNLALYGEEAREKQPIGSKMRAKRRDPTIDFQGMSGFLHASDHRG